MRRTAMKRRRADNHLTGEEWTQLFHLLLTRSGGQCECCGRSLWNELREKVSVQHRRAQGMGGTALAEAHDLSNLLVLCGTGNTGCHGWVETQERDEAEARGLWIRHDYRDGEPVPASEYPLVLHSGRRVFLDPIVPIYLPHPDEWNTGVVS